MKKRLLFSALLGNLIEYYDYALYGFLATSIATWFFPETTEHMELLQTFGIYALGSIAKPLGALFFGHMSDYNGRSKTLKYSMLGIAVPTMIIGLLPNFESWGYITVIGLIICRFLQGFFLGGEVDNNRVFIFEHIQGRFPCFANSLSGSSSYLGIFIASTAATYTLQNDFPDDAWRWLFLASGLLAFLLFFIRQFLPETPVFLKHKTSKTSFLHMLKTLKRPIFSTILICGAVGGCYHFFMIFSIPLLSNILGIMTTETATSLVPNSLLTFTVLSPLVGLIADKVGPIRVQKWGIYMMSGVLGVFGFYLYNRSMPPIIFQFISISLAFFATPGYLILMKAFPATSRCRGLGLGHTIGSMIFSGGTPIIAVFLYQKTQNIAFPLLWVVCLVLSMIFGLKLLRHHPLRNQN